MSQFSARLTSIAAGCLVGLGCYALVWAAHGTWQDAYRGADGQRCCGERDCVVVQARVLAQDQETVTVEVNGIALTLPAKAVHTSEDLSDYWCARHPEERISVGNTRCIFIAIGG